MPARVCILFILTFLALPLEAQDEPVHMKPEFALTFPLVKNGDDVTVQYPILIDPATILKPGMVLRTLYVINFDVHGSDMILAHAGSREAAYSRSTLSPDQQDKMPPELAHELENYRRTVWTVPNNFVLAMAQYPTDVMHLIYSPSGKSDDLADGRFSFFDGLLVGLPGGKVTVIAVEKESKTEAAGIKAGDEILSVGGIPTHNDLAAFASAYSVTKKNAFDNEVQSYPMSICPAGEKEAHLVNVPMPPSIKGGLMHGF